MVTLNGIGGDLTKTEFEIGGTRFAVSKLPAMAGFDLLEAVRHELGKAKALSLPLPTEVLNEDDRSIVALKDIVAFLEIVLSLEPAFVRQVRQKLFEKVAFSNTRVPTPQQLAGAEEMAFDGLEPIAIYEVLVRSAAVNFTPSLDALVSRLKDAPPVSSPSAPSE